MIKRRFFVAEMQNFYSTIIKTLHKKSQRLPTSKKIIFLDIKNLYTYMSIGKCLENESYFSITHSSLFLNFKQVSKSECNT